MRPGRFTGIVSIALIGACTSATSATSTTTHPSTSSTVATTTTRAPTTTTTIPVETGVWRPIPEGPLSPRVLALAIWTGEELIVVGGYDDDPCLPTRRPDDGGGGGSASRSGAFCFAIKSQAIDGAAFHPDTGTWRPIATPPVPLTRSIASAVVHDGIVYILAAAQPGAFLAYHPADDRWEELPPPSTRLGILIDAGDRLALFRYDDSDGNPDDWLNDPNREVAPGLMFDPETMVWSEIPPDPLIPSFDRSMVWTGSELVLLGAEAVPQPGSAPAFMRAAVFDPVTGTWRRLPDSDLVISGGYGWYLADGRLINPTLDAADGGETNPYDRFYPRGGILDPESGEWLPLPDPPVDPYVPGAFIGYSAGSPHELLSGYGWLFDPATGRWQSLPAPPDNSSLPVPRNGSTVLFAGPDLVVWGGFLYGEDGRGEMVAAGWMWRPGT